MANANRNTKLKPEPFTPLDFMPDYSQAATSAEDTEDEDYRQFKKLWNKLKK